MAKEWLDEAIKQYVKKCEKSKKGTKWRLRNDEAEALFDGPCYWCGKPVSRFVKGYGISGIDRLASDGDYEPENCVSCCGTCNWMKGDMEVSHFMWHILQVARHSLREEDVYMPGSRFTYRLCFEETYARLHEKTFGPLKRTADEA